LDDTRSWILDTRYQKSDEISFHFLHKILDKRNLTDETFLSIKHQASSIKHQASSIKHQASSIEHRASSIEHRASSIEHREIFIPNYQL